MKNLTVKQKNIEYSYNHGMECLVKDATREITRALPRDKTIQLSGLPEIRAIRVLGKQENPVIQVESRHVVDFESMVWIWGPWEDLTNEEKMKIYNSLFLKFR